MTKKRIIIVEDEQLVADDLRETLEYLGYNVVALVASGEEAIVQVELIQPDLVLMDIRLAGEMDGVEASQEIQSRFHVPVVYLTANADRATLERVKATHPFGYVIKPFDERTLATTIEIAFSRHQAEVGVHKALAEAESQNQLKSQYLCMAVHEFRNPLAAIKLGSELLKHYGERMSEDKKQKQIERIESATNSLKYLLDDVLTLGQAESGKLECNPAPMDIVSFCTEMIEALQLSTTEQYQIRFVRLGNCSIAYLDEKLLWHLLNNLLSNAIKYSPKGGVVSLTLFWEEDTICFQVQDWGIGIPKESQAKLFEPFQRAGNVGHIQGTGLGLAIVKQCVELHKGTISFESAINQGSTFVVKLPTIKDATAFTKSL
ncbi:hybrid sensor histidine kinase/response regulator [Iningainema tapete]|uniref:histidine kinase n=1 Tax=Iningainema tapete BLCC-T55 TaxID=2748662 RepID=A0A8J6XMX9_9CYAN|nr:ATP-binding protein [Iningainema tapete]MBD2776142.1 response regulator [Iningainema tapete BLCC-T55]